MPSELRLRSSSALQRRVGISTLPSQSALPIGRAFLGKRCPITSSHRFLVHLWPVFSSWASTTNRSRHSLPHLSLQEREPSIMEDLPASCVPFPEKHKTA